MRGFIPRFTTGDLFKVPGVNSQTRFFKAFDIIFMGKMARVMFALCCAAECFDIRAVKKLLRHKTGHLISHFQKLSDKQVSVYRFLCLL